MLFEYLKLLNADLLQRLHELSQQVHAQVIAKRKSGVTEETQNVFMNGELVLLQKDPDKTYPTKLSLPFTGPYEFIQQKGNVVTCRHLAMGTVADYPVQRLKYFHGTHEDGFKAACEDFDQTELSAIFCTNQIFEDGD